MNSILIVEGASLTKRNGGGVRSRVVLATLQALGDVHVINIVAKERHAKRVEPVQGVASQSIVVARPKKPDASREKIAELMAQYHGTKLLVLRYFNTWAASGIEKMDLPAGVSTWLDLDDREDQIVLGKLQNSRIWPLRALAKPLSARKKRDVEMAARTSALCSLASETDLVDFAPGANVVALANVVPPSTPETLRTKASTSASLLFVGAYSWPPNVQAIEWFITHCWGSIVQDIPAAELHVVGAGKQSVCDELAQKHKEKTGIKWHFNVPELDAFYAQSRAVISPVELGSGSKIKVIEAAAYERPVVVTPHSARGLHPAMQKALKIAATPEEFSAACRLYLEQPKCADHDGAELLRQQHLHHSVETFKRNALHELVRINPTLPLPSEVTLASPLPNEAS